MVQRRHGRDTACEQGIDQAVVEVKASQVDAPAPSRKYSWPRNGKPVRAEAQALHQVDIRLPPVVVVAGDGARAAIGDPARCSAERVPDRPAATVRADRTLDLVGRCGDAPPKPGRKLEITSWLAGRLRRYGTTTARTCGRQGPDRGGRGVGTELAPAHRAPQSGNPDSLSSARVHLVTWAGWFWWLPAERWRARASARCRTPWSMSWDISKSAGTMTSHPKRVNHQGRVATGSGRGSGYARRRRSGTARKPTTSREPPCPAS